MAKKQPVTRWHDGTTPIEDLPEADQIAHAIALERADLAPSVDRIMSAELTEEQQLTALTAFRDSLTEIDDPNRDPRVAIANATG